MKNISAIFPEIPRRSEAGTPRNKSKSFDSALKAYCRILVVYAFDEWYANYEKREDIKMDHLDFFNRYIMGSVQMLISFYFYTKLLNKKINPTYYFLFALLGITIIESVKAGNITKFIIYILLLAISGFLVCKIRNVSVVLYAVIIVEIMQFTFGIFNSVLCILYPSGGVFHQEIIGILFMGLGYLSLPAAVICCCTAVKFFSYDKMTQHKYTLIILAPTLMIFLIGEYINSVIYGNTIVTDGNRMIINTNHYQMLMIQTLGMASLFCIMFYHKKLSENFYLNTKLSLFEQEEHSLNQYVTEAKTRYEKTRSFRHDIKNHMTVLKKLLQEEKTEQAINYIRDMDEITEELSFPCNTNNPAVDILIENKLGTAKNMGIDVSCSLSLPYPCMIRDIDFAIILSNALDNAVYACKSMDAHAEKYIRVAGKIQGDFIFLEIENSCQKRGQFRKGTGLLNIQTVAEKYHGAVNIKSQSNSFLLSVLLIIPPHSESFSPQIC